MIGGIGARLCHGGGTRVGVESDEAAAANLGGFALCAAAGKGTTTNAPGRLQVSMSCRVSVGGFFVGKS